jgi:CDP-6-deoxy-D-xylo-4-hexulose-3-dehydrase
MQAACGLAQLRKANGFISARKENFAFLKERLSRAEEFLVLPRATEGADPSWFGFPITLRDTAPISRVDLLSYLDQNKIGTRLLFAGNLTRQPSMAGRNYRISDALINTDKVMKDTFWIGLHPSLSREALDYACQKIDDFLGVDFS